MPQGHALLWCEVSAKGHERALGYAPPMLDHIVLVGAGQAAIQAIDTLRRKGFAGELTLVGEEPWLPYQRPPLSKKFLSGAMERDRLLIRPETFFADHKVQRLLGRRVQGIQRHPQTIHLDDGVVVRYDRLLLATGSRPRRLSTPGADLAGVHLLRNIADVERIRAELLPGKRLVIIGAGYIGLEVAATAREMGIDVTVLEQAERVLSRVTCPQLSSFYQSEHASHGVRIDCGAQVSEIEGGPDGRVSAVVCDDGTSHPADVVLVGVGVSACDELAQAAGLECSNGIVVDQHCRTTDPHIYAAGDCTSHPNIHYGRRVRLESVDNAFEQGTSAALNMLGTPTPHDKLPWFWSDQYDLKMIIIGLSQGYDEVVMRGSVASRSFSACYLREGELIAVDTINSPKDQMAARKLVAARLRPDRAKLAEPSVALKDCL
jgi:3-phenylpropionate/trans-cinnamate dioxygenase ferredoxin reductase component